jgi:hypothetical protein
MKAVGSIERESVGAIHVPGSVLPLALQVWSLQPSDIPVDIHALAVIQDTCLSEPTAKHPIP